ncbi:MAG TPA: D-glycero-beta-D-manno-heptose-7-phosphate kinase [Crocinitomix sp.]|nr:D-glycero-beta-D-manno-heptose-7-phosphate kinase [Crocinitomix sp.]
MIDLKTIFKSFSNKKIIVIGDVMIDTYIKGKVNRISPEAPVPVVKFESKENRLGGAGNVALNIKALGAKPFICSIVGNDENATLLNKLINQNHLSDEGLIKVDDRTTTVKTRIIGNNQQLIRIDQEDVTLISSQMAYNLIETVKDIALKEKVDAIIFQDYNKGVLVAEVIEKLTKFANSNSIPVVVDPKKDNFLTYKNVTLFKPNLNELKEGLDIDFDYDNSNKSDLLNAIEVLKEKINPKYVFVTLSEHGVFINDETDNFFIPAHLRNITDVSGAGDTVISVATLCLTSGLKPNLIAEISNLAGGLVCEKVGVVSIDKEQLMQEVLKL